MCTQRLFCMEGDTWLYCVRLKTRLCCGCYGILGASMYVCGYTYLAPVCSMYLVLCVIIDSLPLALGSFGLVHPAKVFSLDS